MQNDFYFFVSHFPSPHPQCRLSNRSPPSFCRAQKAGPPTRLQRTRRKVRFYTARLVRYQGNDHFFTAA